MNDSTLAFALFVYGTLKKGFPAHERFFGKDAELENALVRGELFDLPAGYPALAVPQKDILADAEKQRGKFIVRRGHPVHGETIRFDEPGRTLPMLDAFEGFDPEGESLYVRVLITAWSASGASFPVWAYVMESPSGERLPGGRWPR